MYERHQNLWKGYCLENMIPKGEECNDQLLKKFFVGLEQKYAPSTLWVVYSCVSSFFVEKYGKNLNSFARLSRFLKQKRLKRRFLSTMTNLFLRKGKLPLVSKLEPMESTPCSMVSADTLRKNMRIP